MNKKAQFYLIAAIIIIVIVFGIYTAGNYVKTKQEKTIVYDLKKEFGLESGKIDDFALYNNDQSSDYLEQWIDLYAKTKAQNLDTFIVIYGNETSLTMVNYAKLPSGGVSIGASYLPIAPITRERSQLSSDNFNIQLGNATLNFILQPGKNFIFAVKEGDYVATSQ